MKKQAVKLSALLSALIILDQLTKTIASNFLKTPLILIDDFFQFLYTENTGIAFSIEIPSILIIFLTPLVIVFLIYLASKELNLKNPLSSILLTLIVAGALANVIDRIFRGFVIDFISLWIWPLFNFADIYITIGVLAILIFYGKINRVKKPK